MSPIPWLSPKHYDFPDPSLALDEPNGLLAVGGDLSPDRILAAYQRGIFPWFNPGDPILWWSPSPRTVIYPDQLHISKSLRKTLRQGIYRVTFDHDFRNVMRSCAAPRTYADGTWISDDIIAGYCSLHERGLAHSVTNFYGRLARSQYLASSTAKSRGDGRFMGNRTWRTIGIVCCSECRNPRE